MQHVAQHEVVAGWPRRAGAASRPRPARRRRGRRATTGSGKPWVRSTTPITTTAADEDERQHPADAAARRPEPLDRLLARRAAHLRPLLVVRVGWHCDSAGPRRQPYAGSVTSTPSPPPTRVRGRAPRHAAADFSDVTRSDASLRRFLHGLPGVDQVGAEARAAALGTRSIKTTAKAFAIDLAIRMVDLTTLEGQDTHGKVRALAAKAMHPDPADPTCPMTAAVCVYPDMVATATGGARRQRRARRRGRHGVPERPRRPRHQARRHPRRRRGGCRRDRHGHRPRRLPLRALPATCTTRSSPSARPAAGPTAPAPTSRSSSRPASCRPTTTSGAPAGWR